MKLLPAIFYLLAFTLNVNAQNINRYDVVISEIMADPAPAVGLPNNEWIEIKNVSASPINLQGWRIADATGQSGAMPSYILQPDSMVIICANSAAPSLSVFGAVLPVTSFPSLDNDGDLVILKTENNMVMHAIEFNIAWYKNELKKEGGWTLEMIDPKNACAGILNWKASMNITGGTPGKINSVHSSNTNQSLPLLTRAYSTDNQTLILVFDEGVDSASSIQVSNYQVDNGLNIVEAFALEPLFNKIQLRLNQPMMPGRIYHITATNIRSCSGQSLPPQNKVRAGTKEEIANLDLVVNEILFNPRSNGNDFVEFFNRSAKIVDAADLFIANRNSSGVISSARPLSTVPFLLFPGDHIVATTDLENLKLNYLVKEPAAVFVLPSLPSFPDDEGIVVLLNKQGGVVDEVNYHRNWHFKLIDNDEGISLERIDPDAASQLPTNWQSAASTAGYGTPTYVNSQFKQNGITGMEISVSPKIFSPDNDGHDDFAMIHYAFIETGYVANVTIFDAAGRPVKHLVKNGTLAQIGSWKWDGLDENNQSLPAGHYIVFTEIFDLQGRTKRFKNVVVLAKRL